MNQRTNASSSVNIDVDINQFLMDKQKDSIVNSGNQLDQFISMGASTLESLRDQRKTLKVKIHTLGKALNGNFNPCANY